MRTDKKSSQRNDKKAASRGRKQGVVGYSKKSALLEDAITQMNAGKYGRSSAALKELLALEPLNMEARRLFATLHLRLGSLIPARQAFESLVNEAFERQDYWLAESLLREYLAAGPRCVPFLEKLGTICQDKGDALAAVTEYGKAIDILVEDPDPERPNLASELYAKIRELAPASPVAFRLASFFDAESGGLIVSGKTTSHELPESATGTPESPAAFVPSSATEELAGHLAEPPRDSEHSDQTIHAFTDAAVLPPTPSPGPEHQSSVDATAAIAEAPCHEIWNLDERTPIQETTGSSQPPTAEPEPVCESTSAEPQAPPPHPASADGSSAITFVDFLHSGANHPVDRAEVSSSEAASSESSKHGLESHQASDTDSLSAPMPWERVEDSSIRIPEVPEPEPDAPMRLLSGTEPSQATPVSLSLESRPENTGAVAESSTEPTSGDTQLHGDAVSDAKADVLTPAAEEISPESSPERHSKEGLSWESVLARLRDFAGAPSSLDQKEDTPNVEIPRVSHPAGVDAAAVPVTSLDTLPDQPDLTSLSQAVPGSVIAPEPVAAPMPWDQVQDATIKIDLPTALEPAESHVAQASAGLSSDQSESPAAGTSCGAIDTVPPEVAAPTAAEETEPSAFSYAASAPSAVVEGPDSAVSNAAPSGADSAALTVHDELAVQTPVPEIVPPPPVEPATSVDARSEPAGETPVRIAASADPESVPPVEEAMGTPEPPDASLRSSPVSESISFVGDQGGESTPAAAVIEPSPFPEEPPRLEQPLHWKTGEVAVQTHRPTPKKRKRSSQPVEAPAPNDPPVETASEAEPEVAAQPDPVLSEPSGQSPAPVPQRDAWVSGVESIRFVETPTSTGERAAVPLPVRPESPPVHPAPAVVSAVDVLFDTTRNASVSDQRDRKVSRRKLPVGAVLSRIRFAFVTFLVSCFSTTRAIVTTLATLAVLVTVLLVLGVGAVGMAWLIMEEKPTPAYQALTTFPQRVLTDAKKNGYLLLLGFEAPPGLDPVQAGYERKADGKDPDLATACDGPASNPAPAGIRAPSGTVQPWFGTPDPAAQFRRNQDQIKGWVGQAGPALGRYRQWLTMGFDDWGYGQPVSPPCSTILATHRLHVAEGFAQAQGLESGVDRLESDLEAWRTVLSQAKTLPVKMMALQAINDDVAVASGLLVRPETDGVTPDRLARMLRPLDQMELSLRWPMQSQLVVASKAITGQLKADRFGAMPWYVRVASMLPLPKQQRFNDYARYYEASYKAAGEGRFGSMPKRLSYVRSPATSVVDLFRNPIENLVGLEPLAEWEFYSGQVVDTDARLRLASLQVWLRRGPQGADLMTQIARAGQSFYDPFTGLPMLVNLAKGVMYSVGHDGKDQDAHLQADVVATIPPGVTLTTRAAPVASGLK